MSPTRSARCDVTARRVLPTHLRAAARRHHPARHPQQHRLAAPAHERAPTAVGVGPQRRQHRRLARHGLPEARRQPRPLQRGRPRLRHPCGAEQRDGQRQRGRGTPHDRQRQRPERDGQRRHRDDRRGRPRPEHQADDDDRQHQMPRMARPLIGREVPPERQAQAHAIRSSRHPRGRRPADGAHTVTCAFNASSFFGPIPETWARSSTEAKPPCCVRYSRIFCAVAGPTPSSVSSCSAVAELRLMGAAARRPQRRRPQPDYRRRPRRQLAAAPPPPAAARRGTTTCCPSAIFAAKLMACRSVAPLAPPARRIASSTRWPSRSR